MKFTELTEEEYQKYIEKGEEAAFFQMIENKANREQDGQEVRLLGVKDRDGEVVAACLFTLKKTGVGKKFYYSNRGPVLDYHNHGLVRFYLQELSKYLKANNGLYVKLDPNWIYKKYDKDVNEKEDYETQDTLIKIMEDEGYVHQGFTRGYSRTSQARWMSVLDLGGFDEKSLVKSFDSQRKRNIKKAQKFGVRVRFLDVDEIGIFMDLYKDTSERQGFFTHPNPKEYFTNFKKTYGDKVLIPLAYLDLYEYVGNLKDQLDDVRKKHSQMVEKENKNDKTLNKIAEAEKQIEKLEADWRTANDIKEQEGSVINLAAGIYFETPYEMVYNSGASSSEFAQFVGPYMMHYEMMKYCMEKGIDRYNFYGVSGDFSEDGEDYGVYRFKRGFNAEIEELVGDFVKVISPVQYNIYKVKSKLQQMKK
ncbi:aminoacyltransferase [Salinicoccus sediminis]|uniref:Aminoacyltransferase n=1 Tax=Salinicoccus sediminis TaxID=1432562 RepID=A0A0M2SLU4_9STAP|nr:aminoacyltransferase [Salinicoccus sediminis]KKK35659.1 aminoacyltransferase [Salinicoccus sediminis]